MKKFTPPDANQPDTKVDPSRMAEQLYEGDLAKWRARADVLVTCICMGGRHYAAEVSKKGPMHGAKPEPRQTAIGNGQVATFTVVPEDHRLSESERAALAQRAETARRELSYQTQIPLSRWSALALAVMASNRLLAYLRAQGLLDPLPNKSTPATK